MRAVARTCVINYAHPARQKTASTHCHIQMLYKQQQAYCGVTLFKIAEALELQACFIDEDWRSLGTCFEK